MTRPDVVLERVGRLTPLGLRFVDDATGRDAGDSLVVEVYHSSAPEQRVVAQPNRRGAFFVSRLPGSRPSEFESGDGSPAFWATTPQRAFVIDVRDRRRQFQPFTVVQMLPMAGFAVPACLAVPSPPSDRIPLFSTPSRTVPAGMAVIRAELRARLTMPDGSFASTPASWAVVAASLAGQPPVRGMADGEGRVAILAPYPEPTATAAAPSSPPFAPSPGLWDQEWPVRLEAFYQPQARVPAAPDLCRTLAQPSMPLWMDAEATRPVSELTLQYGRELIVPALIVGPTGPPA